MKVFGFGTSAGLVFFVCVMLFASESAFAAGGSWGSSGSVGYSRGSWGSRGGVAYRTPVRNLLGSVFHGRQYASSGGSVGYYSSGSRGFASTGSRGYSYASYGSSGGSSGGSRGYAYASSGGSWGSSYPNSYGTSYISAPSSMMLDSSYPGTIIEGPVMGGTIDGGSFGQPAGSPQSIIDGQGVTPNEGGVTPGSNQFEIPPTPGPTPANDSDEIASLISNANSTAVLSVNVPEEAKVYINGRLTRTEGDVRSYVSRGLKSGKKYDYRVKAVLSRNGKEIVRNQRVKLVPGLQKSISFDFDQPATTTIALKVPSDAEVILSGNKTSATGRIRYYASQELEDGESWKDYKIRVSVNRDGKTITQEKTIDISSGEMRMVAFDFDNSAQIVKK